MAKPPVSILETGQPPLCILNFGQTWVGVFPEVEKFAAMLFGSDDHLWLRILHAVQEILESRVGAQAIPYGVNLEERKPHVPLVITFF